MTYIFPGQVAETRLKNSVQFLVNNNSIYNHQRKEMKT